MMNHATGTPSSITNVTSKIFTEGPVVGSDFRSMNSISFCCKLATVLLCLSLDIANDDLVCYFIMTLNMRKRQKMQISYQFRWCVQLQINAISKRIELERWD